MSAAVFTASPQMSKVNLFLPTTPDMTGPEWSPTRISSAGKPHLLAQSLHPRHHGLHFKRREAGVDSMPAVGRRHAGDRHIGVAHRL